MASRLCRSFLALIGQAMLGAFFVVTPGALFLFAGLLLGAAAVWSSSPTAAAALAAIFAHPVFGPVVGLGLAAFVTGLLMVLAMLVLYVLLSAVCCTLAAAAAGGKQDACDCEALCLLGPLFPAAALLILALFIAPVLLFGGGREAPGVTPDALLNAASWLLGLFGLLLALAPFIWCCCRGCKCRDPHTDPGPVLTEQARAEAH